MKYSLSTYSVPDPGPRAFEFMLLNPHITTYKETVAWKRLGNLLEMTQLQDSERGTKSLAPRPSLPLALQDGTVDFLKASPQGVLQGGFNNPNLMEKRLKGWIWRQVQATGHPLAPPLPALATMKDVG